MATQPLVNQRAGVRAMQAWLNATGSKLKEDGILGPNTRSRASMSDSPLVSVMLEAVDVAPEPTRPNDRATYWPAVQAQCRALGVSEALIDRFVAFESGWNAKATSSTGARGLFQLTSWPVRQYNQDVPKEAVDVANRIDPAINIRVGVWYVRYCALQVGVDPMSATELSLARIYGAYNLGPAAFRLWEQGQHQSRIVLNAWATQAAALRKGGISAYLENVQRVLA